MNTLLYIPDYLSSEDDRLKEYNHLCELLTDEYKCIYADVDIRKPQETYSRMRHYLELKPSRVISSGIGGFFAVNYFGGINRICLDPLTGYTAIERRITSKVFHHYMRLFPDFIKEDHCARTYRWAIYSQYAIDKGYNDPPFFIKTATVLNSEITLSDYQTRASLIELLDKIKQREINNNQQYGQKSVFK